MLPVSAGGLGCKTAWAATARRVLTPRWPALPGPALAHPGWLAPGWHPGGHAHPTWCARISWSSPSLVDSTWEATAAASCALLACGAGGAEGRCMPAGNSGWQQCGGA